MKCAKRGYRGVHVILAATLPVVGFVTPRVQAATWDWQPPSAAGGGSVSWANPLNWGGTAPADDLVTDVARFDKVSYFFQPNAGTVSVFGIQIGDGSTSSAAVTISGNSLSIGAGGVTQF